MTTGSGSAGWEEFALAIHRIGAVKFGEFTLKSGQLSPVYVDLRGLVSHPDVLRLAGQALLNALQGLDYDANSATYSWDSLASALKPFAGYAVYVPSAETLTIDPSDTAAPPSAAHAKAASFAGAGRIRLGVESALGRSSMALVRGPGEYPIPFLPSPASGLELRVGGDGGYWIKPVKDLSGIDEPVEIRAAASGTLAFTFACTAPGITFSLLDESTGAVYDAAAAQALPVAAGTNGYRLLAGDAAFVQAKARDFRAAVPSALGLSQNFPNPVRGLTRIALQWPAAKAQDRRAFLEVLDMQGRRVALRRIDGIKVGRQVVELDASGWKSGLYIYRLTVMAGGRTDRLQKRMLVAP